MIKVISLNPDPIYLVVSRCLKSQYQRNSIVNFLKATGGRAAILPGLKRRCNREGAVIVEL